MNRLFSIVSHTAVCLFMISCHTITSDKESDSGTIGPNGSNGACDPGTWRCVSSPTGHQQCLSDGTWNVMEVCDLCVGEGECITLLCRTNEITCENGVLKKCNTIGDDYEWQTPCQSQVCKDNGNECALFEEDSGTAECTANEFTCNNGYLKKCNANGNGYDWQTPCGTALCDDVNGECLGCVPQDAECDETRQYLETCNSNGIFDQTDCWAENKTCDNAECAGECVVGHYRCFETSGDDWGDSQVCDGTGTWQANSTCVKSGYDELCNRASGLCEDNSEEYAGHFSTSWGGAGPAFDEDFLATPILIQEDVVLRRIGMLTAAASSGGEVVLAVYNDRTDNGEHYPYSLLAVTSVHPLVAGGSNLSAPTPAGVTLDKGEIYWAVAHIHEESGEDIQFYGYDSSSMNGWTTKSAYESLDWEEFVPNTYPFNLPYVPSMGAGELGIFIEVQKYWQ